MLWTDSLRETYAAIYKHVKDVNPSLGVGWHICSTNPFNPIYRSGARSGRDCAGIRLFKVRDVSQLRWRTDGGLH